jgi:hypothetical protein
MKMCLYEYLRRLLVNKDEEEQEDEGSYACGGMARAALWLLGTYVRSIYIYIYIYI